MTDHIARLLEPLLRFLFPATGRHRGGLTCPDNGFGQPSLHVEVDLLNGEDNAIVRPYLVADELRLQRRRRRALWLAVHGVDVGPKFIHGMELA
ncbi:hypothetical protein AB0N81_04750 [Streptomyces sp. NPDC093510]|uniref:hypothetical protein n=1 Tax=Streptomyces sp. NPDC093510 TaxID=3155199 RepID=UPI00343B316C